MTRIIDHKVFIENEHEYRVNVFVKYNNKNYVVSITTYHSFSGNRPYVEYINSFRYMTDVRESKVRDIEIKRALKGMFLNV